MEHEKELALFLKMLPNIQSLVVDGKAISDKTDPNQFDPEVESMFVNAAKIINKANTLKEATVTEEGTGAEPSRRKELGDSSHPLLQLQKLTITGYVKKCFKRMLSHPGLVTVHFAVDSDLLLAPLTVFESFPPRSLRHIQCTYCHINMEKIRKFVSCASRLQSLIIIRLPFKSDTLEDTMNYHEIGESLRKVGKRLHKFHLVEYVLNDTSRNSYTGRVGSLVELRQLIELEIDYVPFVVGSPKHENVERYPTILPLADVIPVSLERLVLYGCNDDKETFSEPFLRQDLLKLVCSKRTVNLQSVLVSPLSRQDGANDILEFDSTFAADLSERGWGLKRTDDEYLLTRLHDAKSVAPAS